MGSDLQEPKRLKRHLTLSLKNRLDTLSMQVNIEERIAADPIEFPHRFKNPADIEVSALIASSLAYGKIQLFKMVLNRLFVVMGESPANFCSDFSLNPDVKRLQGIKYRFNTEEDIVALIYLIGKALKEYGSLAKIFYSFNKTSGGVKEGLIGFVNYFLSGDCSPLYQKGTKPGNVRQFFPSPLNGGACKRLNLFLRWMVRCDEIDFGIWKGVSPSELIIPLDIHISRIAYRLGLTTRKTTNWNMAKEITENLKILDPSDPVKYDFALCHHGISGGCGVDLDPAVCEACVLRDVCR